MSGRARRLRPRDPPGYGWMPCADALRSQIPGPTGRALDAASTRSRPETQQNRARTIWWSRRRRIAPMASFAALALGVARYNQPRTTVIVRPPNASHCGRGCVIKSRLKTRTGRDRVLRFLAQLQVQADKPQPHVARSTQLKNLRHCPIRSRCDQTKSMSSCGRRFFMRFYHADLWASALRGRYCAFRRLRGLRAGDARVVRAS